MKANEQYSSTIKHISIFNNFLLKIFCTFNENYIKEAILTSNATFDMNDIEE